MASQRMWLRPLAVLVPLALLHALTAGVSALTTQALQCAKAGR